jgi:ABC-type transport system involved in cytochrome bd biosynthesis fused ATPase/permease subunit
MDLWQWVLFAPWVLQFVVIAAYSIVVGVLLQWATLLVVLALACWLLITGPVNLWIWWRWQRMSGEERAVYRGKHMCHGPRYWGL